MYRILIVDDNNRDRRIVRDLINWTDMNVEVVGTASNGREALDLVDRLSPQIILSDISMPELDGIAMSHILQEQAPDIRILFMSCHDDFEFAKSAIDLNVHGYVLKPLILEEVASAVRKVVCLFDRERRDHDEMQAMRRQIADSLPMVREEFFRELLHGTFSQEQEILARMDFLQIRHPSDSLFQIIGLELKENDVFAAATNIADKYLIPYTIRNMLGAAVSDSVWVYPVQHSCREFSAILFLDIQKGGEHESVALECAISFHNSILEKFGLFAVAGISRTSESLMDLPVLYVQSLEALRTKFSSEGNPIILYQEIVAENGDSFTESVNLEELGCCLREAIFLKEDSGLSDFITRFLPINGRNQTEAYCKSLAFSTVNIMTLTLIENGYSFQDIFPDETVIWRKLGRFDTITDLRCWLFNMIKTVADYLRDQNKSRDIQIVEAIREVIRTRFQDPLSVEDIVKNVFLSGRQANKIFKKETGSTIFDYLLEVRIDTAKKLLRKPDSKIYLIPEQIGYASKSHFILMFRKVTGITPAEYKAKHVI